MGALLVFWLGGFLGGFGVQAAEFNFTQSILPVRFVYLGRDGAVEKVWSNVSDRDRAYVVKFFDSGNGKEIKMNFSGVKKYCQEIKTDYLEAEGERVAGSFKRSVGGSLMVDLIQRENSLEEIRTYA